MTKTIRIKLIEPTSEKLKFVKLIKDCSGLGLRESKDLCDNLHNFPNLSQEMPVRDWDLIDYNTGVKSASNTDYLQKFVSELHHINGKFIINGGVQWERNVKMLKLGVAEKADYSEFCKNYILGKFENSDQMLTFALEKLSKEDLQEIFDKTNIEL
jgi:hypothetical protein